jgi:cell division protein FtsZ
VLLSVAGGSDLGLFEINEAASLVQEAAHEDANIIFGTVIDDSLGDEVRVTVIAAGFDSTPSVMPPRRPAAEASGGEALGGAAGLPFGRPARGSTLPPLPDRDTRRVDDPPAGPIDRDGVPPSASTLPPSRPPIAGGPLPHARPVEDDDDVDVPPFMKM